MNQALLRPFALGHVGHINVKNFQVGEPMDAAFERAPAFDRVFPQLVRRGQSTQDRQPLVDVPWQQGVHVVAPRADLREQFSRAWIGIKYGPGG